MDDRILDSTTVRLYPEEVNQLIRKAGYLISMSVSDLSQLTRDDMQDRVPADSVSEDSPIPPPGDEPVVGVIDTQFDEKVYFSEWVDYHKMIDENIPLREADFYHGTAVTSIIVDGPRGNPGLEDGCGRFRGTSFRCGNRRPFQFFYGIAPDSQHRFRQPRYQSLEPVPGIGHGNQGKFHFSRGSGA